MRAPAVLFIVALAVLNACGGRHAAPDAISPANTAPAMITNANFSDNNPHPWGANAPRNHPVHGVDISRFQTQIDWPTARANGVNFAFIKATEGGDRVDPMFEQHWRGAGQAGVRRGAYHFFYHCRSAAQQAEWFFKNVPARKGDLPPVIDMEWTPDSPTCTIRRPAHEIRADVQTMINMFTRHYGTAPIVYTTVDFYEDNQMSQLNGTDFWLRSVAAHPSDRYSGQHWAFWQYTSTGQIPGIAGNVDINVFAGKSEGSWQNWLAKRAQ